MLCTFGSLWAHGVGRGRYPSGRLQGLDVVLADEHVAGGERVEREAHQWLRVEQVLAAA